MEDTERNRFIIINSGVSVEAKKRRLMRMNNVIIIAKDTIVAVFSYIKTSKGITYKIPTETPNGTI